MEPIAGAVAKCKICGGAAFPEQASGGWAYRCLRCRAWGAVRSRVASALVAWNEMQTFKATLVKSERAEDANADG